MAIDFSQLLKKRSPPLIGVDISTSSVKLVELSQAKGKLRLERYAIEPLARGVVVDGNLENIEAVGEAVKRAAKKAGSRVKNVAMALPTSAVITKKIMLAEGLREEELEVQVESEANQYIPFALDEVNLDFQVIGPSQTSPGDVEVLIAASRKEKVEDRVAVVEMAGLAAYVMDIEAYAARSALERYTQLLPNKGEGQIIAVFQIGANTTAVSVLLNGQVVYEREQAFGGAQLTSDIARTYGITHEEAETKKRTGDLPDNYTTDLLLPFVENLSLEITRALQFFFTSTPYSRVDLLVLAGGCALIPDLDKTVQERTQVNTKVVDPFAGMEIATSVRERQLRHDAPALLVACGLAMRRFDE
ncbi:pilus assembly protein PilM [Parvibium lacunae]|uniref:Pilus assembly protein PilM n=1 Tax=Parvibium lacunae TaxID=1888893 RepID=A0A368KYV6_9BURK|nr:pilus assembly protein PilM [Parvibium lacunae]RCS56590.1 pilus assembly protein PilM [Parvibium lacunae]